MISYLPRAVIERVLLYIRERQADRQRILFEADVLVLTHGLEGAGKEVARLRRWTVDPAEAGMWAAVSVVIAGQIQKEFGAQKPTGTADPK